MIHTPCKLHRTQARLRFWYQSENFDPRFPLAASVGRNTPCKVNLTAKTTRKTEARSRLLDESFSHGSSRQPAQQEQQHSNVSQQSAFCCEVHPTRAPLPEKPCTAVRGAVCHDATHHVPKTKLRKKHTCRERLP